MHPVRTVVTNCPEAAFRAYTMLLLEPMNTTPPEDTTGEDSTALPVE
jgi:hypothetical protein